MAIEKGAKENENIHFSLVGGLKIEYLSLLIIFPFDF